MNNLTTTNDYARLVLSTEELTERVGSSVRAPADWPRDRLQGARSCSLAILDEAVKPAFDWCWS